MASVGTEAKGLAAQPPPRESRASNESSLNALDVLCAQYAVVTRYGFIHVDVNTDKYDMKKHLSEGGRPNQPRWLMPRNSKAGDGLVEYPSELVEEDKVALKRTVSADELVKKPEGGAEKGDEAEHLLSDEDTPVKMIPALFRPDSVPFPLKEGECVSPTAASSKQPVKRRTHFRSISYTMGAPEVIRKAAARASLRSSRGVSGACSARHSMDDAEMLRPQLSPSGPSKQREGRQREGHSRTISKASASTHCPVLGGSPVRSQVGRCCESSNRGTNLSPGERRSKAVEEGPEEGSDKQPRRAEAVASAEGEPAEDADDAELVEGESDDEDEEEEEDLGEREEGVVRAGDPNQERTEDGFLSVGSREHAAGTCRPCVFYHSKGCRNGVECPFCHEDHEKKKRKNKRVQGAKLEKLLERAALRPKADWAMKVLQKYGHPNVSARGAAGVRAANPQPHQSPAGPIVLPTVVPPPAAPIPPSAHAPPPSPGLGGPLHAGGHARAHTWSGANKGPIEPGSRAFQMIPPMAHALGGGHPQHQQPPPPGGRVPPPPPSSFPPRSAAADLLSVLRGGAPPPPGSSHDGSSVHGIVPLSFDPSASTLAMGFQELDMGGPPHPVSLGGLHGHAGHRRNWSAMTTVYNNDTAPSPTNCESPEPGTPGSFPYQPVSLLPSFLMEPHGGVMGLGNLPPGFRGFPLQQQSPQGALGGFGEGMASPHVPTPVSALANAGTGTGSVGGSVHSRQSTGLHGHGGAMGGRFY
uniref:C3H1-type domain-containing protein n=1 Tax=Chromera velia CCMP2878 TaxID=1169474 RepID=A0A0G4GAX8_9ALVE|eukprot:Cvel_20993.t1-p1 / transcript=Cvel_20993.t1 / gene=Cvel_20993 / organism=Chromera_velia_CCMP2878 / gene_product=hypothetical protein / transcript_product=hypothetical protein / location=Cvel_scaffold1933:6634-10233(-) / protein_length=753 / sequence_SO=supercontig / SO=protein_coding / is_pseudo=false